ncbi:pyruvate/oxaloacetate carboxyltransferase [Aromatoleum toluclasticum]|uniref:pyruvate/oxaloacetate carboxyltransferase n=1 Tax=Aromatoleum toluclasticum TaxID=92003 RepID=UPI001D190571|nr:pyruvate/oxaloacetate carboxyltransferase [Aromatoleum toluclasticum]MCC4116687.1 pyruvate/oxaloacetate carboxyltransferase [Aromatoleum toluclasticum]
MTDIRLVDVSLRDGNQSLWGAVGVKTRTMERVCPALGRVGYHALELLSSTQVAVAVRFHREDPWARIDAARRAAPHTTLGFLTTGKRFISFSRTPANLFQLAFDLLRRHGVTRMWIIDPMHDMASARETARMAKRAGFDDVVAGICYTISPVHTDDYFADRVAELDDCEAIDSVYLKDPAGLLTPSRLETLVPHMRRRLKRLRIDELHTHCNTGLAPITLLSAADLGIGTLHCALPPLANGSSHASAPKLVANLRARGHRVDVDLAAMEEASAILTREAKLRRLPSGTLQEYDEGYYRHTLPGGVISTTRRQLAEMGKADLMPAVIEESVRVRSDLGWPIVMTPFAQYIVTQAALNVIGGERYRQLSDEVVDMLMGDWGPMPGPVDGKLLDRGHDTPRARNRHQDPAAPSLDELRARFGRGISDEDLLLRALMPAEQVGAMVDERERRRAGGDGASLKALAEALRDPQRPLSVSFSRGDTSFFLRGGRSAREAS